MPNSGGEARKRHEKAALESRIRGPRLILECERPSPRLSSCLRSDKTASPCILSKAPYGPICSAQIIAVASYLSKEKLRDLFILHRNTAGREEGGKKKDGDTKPRRVMFRIKMQTHTHNAPHGCISMRLSTRHARKQGVQLRPKSVGG